MKNRGEFRLARAARLLLGLFVDRDMLSSIEEDLAQKHADAAAAHGTCYGQLRTVGAILSLLMSLTAESFRWSLTMFKNYLKVALRHIRRRKVYSFINIVGLSVGLACFMLIGLWVKDELSFDRFHEDRDRIFRVLNRMEDGGASYSITYALGPALKAQYAEVEDTCRVWPWFGSLLRHGDRSFMEFNIALADPSFFEMFSFPLLRGDPATALQDRLSIVLSEETAHKYFGDEDPMGKVIHLASEMKDLKVTGIMADVPLNSHLQFDMVSRIEFLGEDRLARWNEWSGPNYVLLRPGVSAADFEARISGIYKANIAEDATYVPVLQPLTQAYLYDYARSLSGTPTKIRRLTLFSVIAAFILFMACINFTNLATAQSAKRAREVGMRKVIGALRRQVMRQFLGEAVLIAFLSLLVALFLVELALPSFNQFTGKSMALLSGTSVSLVLMLVLITFGTGLLAGSYPALFLSAFMPSQTLKDRSPSGSRGAAVRKGLIVVQFSISVCLIICTLVVASQLRFIQSRDLGLEKDHVLYFWNNPLLMPKFDDFRSRLLNLPGVQNVTAAAQLPNQIGENISMDWEGNPSDEMMSVDYTVVDFDFFETFDIPLIQGRGFARQFPTDRRSACVINETAARRMGLEDPVGASLYLAHPAWKEEFRKVRVIGVVKDFHSRSLHTAIRPFVFRMYKPWTNLAFVRIEEPQPRAALARIEAAYEEAAPGFPFDFEFLSEVVNRQYISEQGLASLFRVFSLLSIFIACLGLFGLASFTTEQKTKEIGIRKVLGASVAGIVRLTARDFIRWILLANVVAWPLAYTGMYLWLQEFAYRVKIGVMWFVIAGGLTLLIALLTVSYHALRAALSNPIDSLRYE